MSQMGTLFGTDGVRGVANKEPMTADIAMRLGRAIAYLCRTHTGRHRIVVGKDTRLSGYMLENAMVAGICSMGVDALVIGPLPTPGVAFITQSMRADAGVMISASHNLFQDNGIKFFHRDGYKLPDEDEEEMEKLIFSDRLTQLQPTADNVGKASRIDDARGRYIVFVKETFPKDLSLDGCKMVLDCANGAGYRVAPTVFSELGAEVKAIGVEPNGKNINDGCGSQHADRMAALVKETGADVGIALDGDGDRAIFADEQGRIVDGDAVMAFCGGEMIRAGKLPYNTVVATVMSNIGLELALKEVGGGLVRTAVGDRYVVEEMRRADYLFGGEQSGHLVFREYTTTGDGIITALQVLAIMKRTGLKLSDLAGRMQRMPQVLLNVTVAKKAPIEEIPALQKEIERVESQLGHSGRVLVRYSGTEPLLRVMIEGPDADQINRYAGEIADQARRELC
jgi:phosphoglucosamine mutase